MLIINVPFSLFYAKMGDMNIINIYENYNNYFNDDLKKLFKSCSCLAKKYGFKIYLIGGIVRDLLLNKENFDIDITVEGDAVEFAKILEREAGAEILSTHKNFGTVKVKINGFKVDFASTRSESYPQKGHLPHVENIGCSLEEDLVRRDFTINSLAISLNQSNFAHLIDYVGGYKDLKEQKIKVLHDLSFIDDPTRIIRALKFSIRLGFELDKNTKKLQEKYLENINYDMGQKRLKSEIKQSFGLNSQILFKRFIDEKIYKLISQNEISLPAKNIEKTINIYKPHSPWIVYLGVFMLLSGDNLLEKLELTNSEKKVIIDAKTLIKADLSDDFKLYKAFSLCKIESLIIYSILSGEEKISRFVNSLSKIKISITGQDLLQSGVEPSLKFSQAFDYVLRLKINHPNMKKTEELKLALDFIKA